MLYPDAVVTVVAVLVAVAVLQSVESLAVEVAVSISEGGLIFRFRYFANSIINAAKTCF